MNHKRARICKPAMAFVTDIYIYDRALYIVRWPHNEFHLNRCTVNFYKSLYASTLRPENLREPRDFACAHDILM